MSHDHPTLRESSLFDRATIHEIQRAASAVVLASAPVALPIATTGGSFVTSKRALPHFDDLIFLGASVSRYPLEGYRERCGTDVLLGTRHASKPLKLDIPVTIAGMSFGSLSANAKEALGRGASEVGSSTTTRSAGIPRRWFINTCLRAMA